MRQNIHHYYEQLTNREREFVDDVFSGFGDGIYAKAKAHDVPFAGDDRVERAVDALARAVMESRKSKTIEQWAKAKPRDRQPPQADDVEMDGTMEVHLALKAAGLL